MMSSGKATPTRAQARERRSRARTGCLTCRSRKVKCDETRPICCNCTRVNKACLYQSPVLHDLCAVTRPPGYVAPSPSPGIGDWDFEDTQANPGGEYVSNFEQLPPEPSWPDLNLDTGSTPFEFITGEWGDLIPTSANAFQILAPSQYETPAAAAATPHHGAGFDGSPSFSYFLSSVEPPFITPWDSFNWLIMKGYACELARSTPAVAAAVEAVEILYQSLLSGEDNAAALSKYFVAKSAHLSLLKDTASDMETILVATFLLCCFEVVTQQETVPSTLKQRDYLVTRLEQHQGTKPWSPVSCRIICWLHLFHAKAKHLGGHGMLSPKLLWELLPEQQPLLSLVSLQPSQPPASEIVIRDLQQSLFQFYCGLQRISMKVSALNRHNRPRGASEDEMRVSEASDEIVQRLDFLWQGRPWLVDAAAEDISRVMSCPAPILEELMLLARLCRISYHAEIIYHARGSGRGEWGSELINTARKSIRGILGEKRVGSTEAKLSPAFIWPLFAYIVESKDSDEADWGLQALDHIDNPLWNSAMVKELISGLSREQIATQARVDTRYFCMEKFGTVPPFM